MARTRSSTDNAGADNTAPATAENELLGQQLREMAGQLSTLTEHVHQLTQQQQVVPVEGARVPLPEPTAPMAGPSGTDGETAAAPPQTATTGVSTDQPTAPSVAPSPTASGPIMGEASTQWTERDRVRANLAEFKKRDPPVFEGETTDPWVVEKWVDTMEKLFEDLMIEDHERVPLAVHCLEGNARMWWKMVRPDPTKGNALSTWTEFREELFGAFFSNSVKQQMEDDLKHIRQGN